MKFKFIRHDNIEWSDGITADSIAIVERKRGSGIEIRDFLDGEGIRLMVHGSIKDTIQVEPVSPYEIIIKVGA